MALRFASWRKPRNERICRKRWWSEAPIRKQDSPFGAESTPRFALCADVTDTAAKDKADALRAEYKDLLEPQLRRPFHDGGMWLVRPDGYVVLATGPDGWDELATFLNRIAGRASS
jgi:hypothetical protein